MIHENKKKVAVIGGGFSGLTIAYYLALQGYKVVVYESETRVGGLASGFVFKTDHIEKHYHHIFKTDHDLIQLFDELSIKGKLNWHKSKVGVLCHEKMYPFNNLKDYLALPVMDFRHKVKMVIGSLKLTRQNLFSKTLTSRQLIEKNMGNEAWLGFWEPFFKAKFGRFSNQISAAWFYSRLRSRAASRERGHEILGYPKGGFGVILRSLSRSITDKGGEIFLGKQIKEIRQLDQGFMVDDRRFDIVISTLSPPLTTSIFPSYKATNFDYIGFVGALVICHDRLTPYYWTNVLDIEAPFGVLVEHNNLVPGLDNRFIYLGKYCEAGSDIYSLSEAEIAKKAVGFLEQIRSGFGSKIKDVKVFKDPYAQPVMTKNYHRPSYTCDIPGFYTTSMAHIFPEDRGMNQAIREAKKIVELVSERLN